MVPADPPPAIDDASAEQDVEPVLITYDMCEVAADPAAAAALDGGRVDFERGMSYLPRVTLALIAVNVAVFAWQLATGALADERSIIAAGALHRASVMTGGEVWRLMTATFLHGSVDHLLGNCLVLWIVGIACEHAVGWVRTAGVYLTAALCGSLLSVALSPGPSVGASGAVFGVTAAVVVFLYRHQRSFVVRDKRIGFVLGLWALYQLATGLLTPYIDNAAHLGGAIGGAAVVLMMRPRLVPGAAVT